MRSDVFDGVEKHDGIAYMTQAHLKVGLFAYIS